MTCTEIGQSWTGQVCTRVRLGDGAADEGDAAVHGHQEGLGGGVEGEDDAQPVLRVVPERHRLRLLEPPPVARAQLAQQLQHLRI